MFTTAHLTSGVLAGLLLGLTGDAFAAFVLASVFTDWDYAFQLATGRNHRTFLTHSPPVVAAVLLPLGLVWPLAWPVLAGAMLHFSLDVWDHGVRVHPFKREVVGFRLMPGVERLPFRDYVRAYFRDRRFAAAELALAAGAAVAWVTVP